VHGVLPHGLRPPEGILFWQGFACIFSGSVPFCEPNVEGRQIPQAPSGNRRPQRKGGCDTSLLSAGFLLLSCDCCILETFDLFHGLL